MTELGLDRWVAQAASRAGVPGVAVGVTNGGSDEFAFHGVTSAENPLPVDEHTLFQFGSTGKTLTATAMMVLKEQRLVALDDLVIKHVPELRLRDQEVASNVTVQHLLNHTAGWEGDLEIDTGEGDDALARYIEKMADFQQEYPLGHTVSYNNASLSLAARVIENVTGETFEDAVLRLVLEPVGLANTYFSKDSIMTRRFAVGHRVDGTGEPAVVRPYSLSRAGNGAGGAASTAGDLLRWARFHLGDGRAESGRRVLGSDSMAAMQRPTVEAPGSAFGDAIGLTWMLRTVEGERVVFHGGTYAGQLSAFVMVPERDFAVVSLTNCSPNGSTFNENLVRWSLDRYLDLDDRDPEPVEISTDRAEEYSGDYETISSVLSLAPLDGGVVVHHRSKPESLAVVQAAQAKVAPPEVAPIPLGFLSAEDDRFMVTDGPYAGLRGYFLRDGLARIAAIHFGGRLATRIPTEQSRGAK